MFVEFCTLAPSILVGRSKRGVLSRVVARVAIRCERSVLSRVVSTVAPVWRQWGVLSWVEATVTARVEGFVTSIGWGVQGTVGILGTVPIIAWPPVGSIGQPLVAHLHQVSVLARIVTPVASVVWVSGIISAASLATGIISSCPRIETTATLLTGVKSTSSLLARVKASVATTNASYDGILWEVVGACS